MIINTLMANLPTSIRSFVVANKDESYTIVLNARLSHEQHLISYKHELEHIRNNDYEKKCSIDIIECNGHSI